MKQNNRMPVFRERLRQLMGEMSVTEFANDIGLSRQTIGFYLNGNRIPDCETLAQICAKCNVSANWLLGLSDTKSLDANVAAVMQYTGLTENNVNFLHDPSSVGHNEHLYEYRKSLYLLINDLIEMCHSSPVHTPFWKIQTLMSLFDGATARLDQDLVTESIARNRGYAVLTVNESIAFHASQISKGIERAITDKYSIEETSEPYGRLETIKSNGKQINVWSE